MRADSLSACRLAVGTAQFGMNYGINNRRGMVPAEEVGAIIAYAHAAGIDTLDTAHAYGESERVLGQTLSTGRVSFRIITKLGAGLPAAQSVAESLQRLQAREVAGVLVHDFSTFVRSPRLLDELKELQAKGTVEKIGFSLYYPHEAMRLLESGVEFDLVQVPYSVFDQRFRPLLPSLKARGVEIHARSVFLQGLVFRALYDLPPYFETLRSRLEALHGVAEDTGRSISAVCLGFVLSCVDVDRVVIGVDGLDNLVENIHAAGSPEALAPFEEVLTDLSCQDESLILPFNWKW